MAELWRLDDVSLHTGGIRRVGPLTLRLEDGVTTLTGPSGGGKTSLLHLLAGFETATAGLLTRVFPDPPARPPVFWAPSGDGLWPHLRVEQHLSTVGAREPEALLEVFGLLPLRKRRPEDLSRGERNRLALARVAASDARVWLLDEPLAHLPRDQAESLWSWLLDRARSRGSAVIAATHAPELAASANHQLVLRDGRVETP